MSSVTAANLGRSVRSIRPAAPFHQSTPSMMPPAAVKRVPAKKLGGTAAMPILTAMKVVPQTSVMTANRACERVNLMALPRSAGL